MTITEASPIDFECLAVAQLRDDSSDPIRQTISGPFTWLGYFVLQGVDCVLLFLNNLQDPLKGALCLFFHSQPLSST
jgi:hypothetical protein